MAAVDKIYGNKEEWQLLRNFLSKKNPDFIIKYMYPKPKKGISSIFNGSLEADIWLKQYCFLPFIQAGLKEIYDQEWNDKYKLI